MGRDISRLDLPVKSAVRQEVQQFTTGDIVLCLFGGIPVYDPSSGREFEFPMVWISVFVAAAYVTLDYPLYDLKGVGATSIVISGSRWSWWLSKCCWIIE